MSTAAANQREDLIHDGSAPLVRQCDQRSVSAAHTPIPLAPGYFAGRDGRIYSAIGWRGNSYRELFQDLNSDGYPSTRVLIDGHRRRISTHRLVASAFLEARPSPSHEVRHLDGNKLNNSASNLAWGTRAENAADRERHGRTSRGVQHSNAIKKGLEKQAEIAGPTPGPWSFEPHSGFNGEDPDGNQWPFGYISTKHPSPIFELRPLLVFAPGELEANAQLMAAAPELLTAAKAVSEFANHIGAPFTVTDTLKLSASICDLQAAIAKAEGRQS